jgi:hypothetical protein
LEGKDMQNLPKKPGRPKKVVIDDTRAEEGEDVGIETTSLVKIGTSIVSITTDKNGNILGLTSTGQIRKYDAILHMWDLYQ